MHRLFAVLIIATFVIYGRPAMGQAIAQAISHSAGQTSEVYIVTASEASVFATPDESKPLTNRLKSGRRVQATGEMKNGFLKLSTKSGAAVWVRVSDVQAEEAAFDEGDLSEPGAQPARRAQTRARTDAESGESKKDGLFEGITYDLGASSGSYGGVTYTEVNLGLNFHLSRYLAWRNAGFGRFQSGVDNLYGLDTSMRSTLGADLGVIGATVFGGPGFRFVTKGNNVPFLEGGLVLKLGPFELGGGVKTLIYNVINRDRENDTQYFLILAGGGSL